MKSNEERYKDLCSCPGVVWSLCRNRKAMWRVQFDKTMAFVKSCGRLPSKHSDNEEEKRLGDWCERQRRRRASGLLSIERQKQLSLLPSWRWRRSVEWGRGLADIEWFVKSKGWFPKKRSRGKKERRLARWYEYWMCEKNTSNEKVKILTELRIMVSRRNQE